MEEEPGSSVFRWVPRKACGRLLPICGKNGSLSPACVFGANRSLKWAPSACPGCPYARSKLFEFEASVHSVRRRANASRLMPASEKLPSPSERRSLYDSSIEPEEEPGNQE